MALLRLIRFPNLLIVALTQYLLYYRVIRPAIAHVDLPARFDFLHLTLFVLVTVLITACGYTINDIADYRIDQINRPKRVLIDRQVPLQTAYWMVGWMGLTGFFLSLYLAFFIRQPPLLFLYPVALGGLYAYSAFFKKKFILGNLLIALYCAGAGAVLWLIEQPALQQLSQEASPLFSRAGAVFIWFLGFAFLATYFREIIKDIEDVKGDEAAGCQTMPVRIGVNRTKIVALLTGLLLLLFIGCYGWFYREQFGIKVFFYIILGIGLPLVADLSYLLRANTPAEYHRASQLSKLVMLTGILLLLFIKV